MPSRNSGNKLSIDAVQHSTLKTVTAHYLSQGVTDAQFELVPHPDHGMTGIGNFEVRIMDCVSEPGCGFGRCIPPWSVATLV